MNNSQQKDMEWIRRHLRDCFYEVEEISFLGTEKIINEEESMFLVKIVYFGQTVDRIVFRHGQTMVMLAKNIQVADMLMGEDIVFPQSNGKNMGLSEKPPIKGGNELTANSILFYKEYVSMREHIFNGNKLEVLVCGVKTDRNRSSLNFGEYGDFKVTKILS